MRPSNILRAASPFCPDEYLKQAKQAMARLPPKPIFDILSPMPSHLLNVSLANHIPRQLHPRHFERRLQSFNAKSKELSAAAEPKPHGPFLACPPRPLSPADRADDALAMPAGHHLVYFPPQVPASHLAPDGADKDHCPGAPFVRRLWAGGSVTFADAWESRMRLDGRQAVCVETVEPPVLRTGSGADKVLVNVVRKYGLVYSDSEAHWRRDYHPATYPRALARVQKQPDIEEVRRLVFLRESEAVAGEEVADRPRRVVKAPHTPTASFTLLPDARLLFHFSALTFNAHAIHLDPLYAREREGHAGILVHGPLSLTLMLTLLSRHIRRYGSGDANQVQDENGSGDGEGGDWRLLNLDYKNIAPLYAGEEMRVCLAPAEKKENGKDGDQDTMRKWHVWVEGPEGGLAVKGTATAVRRPLFRKVLQTAEK